MRLKKLQDYSQKEAEELGAFLEDALSEEDAIEATDEVDDSTHEESDDEHE